MLEWGWKGVSWISEMHWQTVYFLVGWASEGSDLSITIKNRSFILICWRVLPTALFNFILPSRPRSWVVLWYMWSLTPRKRFVLFPGTFPAVHLCLYHNAYHEIAGKFTSCVQKVYGTCLPVYSTHECIFTYVWRPEVSPWITFLW